MYAVGTELIVLKLYRVFILYEKNFLFSVPVGSSVIIKLANLRDRLHARCSVK